MMKKLFLLSLALLCFLTTQAQSEIKPTIGINITNVSEDPVTGEAQGQVGWQFGGSILFGEKFYFEPGLFYTHNSLEFTSESDQDYDFESDIKGLRVPVAVGLHLLGTQESAIDLRAFGGASGFFITGVDAGPLDKDDFESPQWGVFAGAGLDFLMLFVDLKYEWSLTDVSGITEFDVGQRRSFYINVGIRL